MGSSEADDDLLLKSFLAEVSEAERDNEVIRFLSAPLPPNLPSPLNDIHFLANPLSHNAASDP
jgi:hypothetical protein